MLIASGVAVSGSESAGTVERFVVQGNIGG
jgi:hypothetical protein